MVKGREEDLHEAENEVCNQTNNIDEERFSFLRDFCVSCEWHALFAIFRLQPFENFSRSFHQYVQISVWFVLPLPHLVYVMFLSRSDMCCVWMQLAAIPVKPAVKVPFV